MSLRREPWVECQCTLAEGSKIGASRVAGRAFEPHAARHTSATPGWAQCEDVPQVEQSQRCTRAVLDVQDFPTWNEIDNSTVHYATPSSAVLRYNGYSYSTLTQGTKTRCWY